MGGTGHRPRIGHTEVGSRRQSGKSGVRAQSSGRAALRQDHHSGHSIAQVKTELSGTASMWFHEIKRVGGSEEALRVLIAHKGRGLTALYRELGPSQYQPSHANLSRAKFGDKLKGRVRREPPARLAVAIDALLRALDEISAKQLGERHQSDLARLERGLASARGRMGSS